MSSAVSPTGTTDDPDAARLARTVATLFGVVFLVVGIAGFIPGITQHYDDMQFAGHHSNAKLLGVFEVSILHNIVHLLFGVAGLALARTGRTAAAYLLGGGLVYAVVWIYGVVVDQESMANFVPLNTPDNWLHFVLALAMIALGAFLLGRLRRGTKATTGTTTHA